MKAKLIITTLIAVTLSLSGTAFAGENTKPLQLKSEPLALVLGLPQEG
jgi:hypothetical protein